MNERDRLLEILRVAFQNHPGSLTLLVFYDDGRTASHFLPPQKVGHDSPPSQEDFSDVKGLAGEILRATTREPATAKALAGRMERPLTSHFYKALRFLVSAQKIVRHRGRYHLPGIMG